MPSVSQGIGQFTDIFIHQHAQQETIFDKIKPHECKHDQRTLSSFGH
jgi:hypothetical protein